MKNRSLTANALSQIAELETFVSIPDVRDAFTAATRDMLSRLSHDNIYAVTDLNLTSLKTPPPDLVGTIRIAAFQPETVTEYERHLNSTQFLYILQGTGKTEVLRDGAWETDIYGEIHSNVPEERWHLVEQGVWHRSTTTGNIPLVVAALHTAKDVEDEYRDTHQPPLP